MTFTEAYEVLMMLRRLYRMERAEDFSTRRSEAAIAMVEQWVRETEPDHPHNTTQGEQG